MKSFYESYFVVFIFSFCCLISSEFSYGVSSQSSSSSTESIGSSSSSSSSQASHISFASSSSISGVDAFIQKKMTSSNQGTVVLIANSVGFDRDGDRTYKADNLNYPFELKCGEYDYRTFHLCPKISFFSPAARVYFDSGDADGKLDMFNDGNLNASIDFVSMYLPLRFGRSAFYDSISWGPALGVGISAPAKSSDAEKATGAPVVLATFGLQFEYALGGNGSSCGFEIGRAIGFSSDESLKKSSDQATYVGLKIKITTETGKK